MGCTSCGKNKASTYKSTTNRTNGATTKPKGGTTKTSMKPVAGFGGYGTKSGSTFTAKRTGGSGTTPISHASNGRTRRH